MSLQQIKKEISSVGERSASIGPDGQLSEVKNEPTVPSSEPSQTSAKAQLASKLKLTIVHAWKERWSEIQWTIQLKKLLAAYSNESVDVAEILMQRALIGSTPISLILSYVKHSVLSQIIPFNTVLKYITEFDDISRPHCVLALLNLAEKFGAKISLSPCPDSPLQLMTTMLALVTWLLKATLHCLQRLGEARHQAGSEHFVIMDNASRAITNILERKAVRALMMIARQHSPDEYREFEQCEMSVRGSLGKLPPSAMSEETREKINTALQYVSKLEEQPPAPPPVLGATHAPTAPAITGLLALEAALNTGADAQPFLDQVLMISRLMKLSVSGLCLELFRGCFMGLLDTATCLQELQWATFIFLKLPQVLASMHQQQPGLELPRHVVQGCHMLMDYSRLLDQVDIKLNFDNLTQFVNELKKAGILSEEQKNSINQRRAEQRAQLRQADIQGGSGSKKFSRITNAETTMNSILSSMDSDPLRTADSMVKVLNLMHSGYSFDMLRLAAARAGRVTELIRKLIRINEASSSMEAMRQPNRNQLFDISFIMITNIFLEHGIETCVARESEGAAVVRWARRWLPDAGRYRPGQLPPPEDQDKVDALLQALTQAQDIQPGGRFSCWGAIIWYLPYAIQEILFAFEHRAISESRVQGMMEHLRTAPGKCLAMVALTYLSSYMASVAAAARPKPLRLLEMLMGPPTPEAANKQPVTVITEAVVWGVLPEGHSHRPPRPLQPPQDALPHTTMAATLTHAFLTGCLTTKTLLSLEQLLSLRGPEWFTQQLVDHLLQPSQTVDTSQALPLALATLHLDLEGLAVALLARVLPRLLAHAPARLTQPRGGALAALAVLAAAATRNSKIGQKEPYVRRLHKRSSAEAEYEDDLDDSEASPSKLRRMSEPQITFGNEEFNFDSLTNKEEDGEAMQNFSTKEPLNKALANLFLLMSSFLLSPALTPRTWFIVAFIQEAIKCGPPHTRFLLQFMPPTMLSQLMRSLPGVFSDDQILRICDLSTISGRKIAAKAICNNTDVMPLDIFD